MFPLLRRYVITIADTKSGIQRRATLLVGSVVVASAAMTMLALLIALNVTSKAKRDVQALAASYRALEIQTANHRAAIEVLIGQPGSQQSALADLRADSSSSSKSGALDPSAGTSGSRPASATASDSAVPGVPASTTPERSSPAARAAFTEALVRAGQTRTLADAVDAAALASPSYRAGVALEIEAQELWAAGRLNDGLVRAIEAEGRFRAAEIEARAHSAAEDRLHRESLAELGDLRAQSPRAELPQPLQPPQPVADVEATIMDVIAQYVSGLENQSVPALKRVWPTLGGDQERAIQSEFENARTVQTLFKDPRITIKGDITTVTGLRKHSLVTQDGQRLSSETRTTMTLRRSGDAWVIERIVHQQ
jgi:SnoaL-like domain